MLVTLLTVCIIVFAYLHVVHQFKTNNDMEVFNMEQLPDKHRLEELCNLRQPLIFDHTQDEFKKCNPAHFAKSTFDLNVVDASNVSVPLNAGKALKLFKKANYYSDNNALFLKNTMLHRLYSQHDSCFRPPMLAQTKYDLIFGGKDALTTLKYTDCCRTFFMVAEGEVEIKLSPPENDHVFNLQKDFVKNEFYSMANPKDHANKFLNLTLKKGQLLFLPPYWWYSFALKEDCYVCQFSYKSVMNMVATLPDIVLGIIQRQNVKIVGVQ